MNIKYVIGAAALVLATSAIAGGLEQAPAVAPAPVANNGFYISGFGGLNLLTDSNPYQTAGWNGGAALGYHFNNFRLEVAGNYLRHSVQSRFRNNDVLGTNFNINAFQMATVMANAYYDFDFGSNLIPYIGAGLGWAHTWEGINITNAALPAFNSNVNLDTNNLAFQGIVGVDYKISDNVRIGVSYHALGWTNSKRRDDNFTNQSFLNKNSFENQINLGLSYYF